MKSGENKSNLLFDFQMLLLDRPWNMEFSITPWTDLSTFTVTELSNSDFFKLSNSDLFIVSFSSSRLH